MKAIYYDGISAEKHAVDARVNGEHLEIWKDALLASWPTKSLRLTDEGEGPIRLQSDGDARLVIEDRDALRTELPHLLPHNPFSRGKIWGWLVGTVALIALLYWGAPLFAEPLAALTPAWLETRFGEAMLSGVVQGKSSDDPSAQAALTRLTDKFAVGAEHVHVIDDPMENAFALPGGNILLYCGLVNEMHSSDELAGVLAHESAHLELHHAMASLIRVFGTSLVMGAIIGDYSGLAGGAWQGAESLVRLAGSRQTEAAADARGLELLARANISPHGFADLMERFGKKDGVMDKLSFLSSHPGGHERAARVKEDPGVAFTPAMSAEDWAAIQSACTH